MRADAEAACAEAFPDESRNGCITSYIELVETGSTMTPAEAEAYGFPYRVCVWPDGFWTLSPRTKSGTLPVGALGCGNDGKAKVTAIVEAP